MPKEAKPRDIPEADEISNQILQQIPSPGGQKDNIASQKAGLFKEKPKKFELQLKNGEISTAPIGNNKVPELKKSEVTTNQATFKTGPTEKKSQLSKPGFALKNKQ
jgi:hypothetical protein